MKHLASLIMISATLCAAPAWAQSASGAAASHASNDAIVKMRQEVAAARKTYNQKVADAKKIYDEAKAAAAKERDAAISAAHAAAGQK
ncbi:hypothetical protein [Cupriavidus sp. BIS7]|uniref:hypothetical protein n=1 Tax=Cupriavidus sp. BIS7 TaxID=1217718 RepID=UPI00031034A5|nr:hypothetical protein [Cupriavidus sp. BIS7]